MSSRMAQMRFMHLPSIRANSVDPAGMEVDNAAPDVQRHNEVVINVSISAGSGGRMASNKARRGTDPYPQKTVVLDTVSEAQGIDRMATDQPTPASPVKMAVPRPTLVSSVEGHEQSVQQVTRDLSRDAIREANKAQRDILKKAVQEQLDQTPAAQTSSTVFRKSYDHRPSHRYHSPSPSPFDNDRSRNNGRRRRSRHCSPQKQLQRQSQPPAIPVERLTHQYKGMRLHSESPPHVRDALEDFLRRIGLEQHARFFRSFGISSEFDLDRLAKDLVRENLGYYELGLIVSALYERANRNRWSSSADQRSDSDYKKSSASYGHQGNQRYETHWGHLNGQDFEGHSIHYYQNERVLHSSSSSFDDRGHQRSYSQRPSHGRRPY